MKTLSYSKTQLILAAALAWSLTGGVQAAAAQSGARLGGVVLDESEGVLPGVTITIATMASAIEPVVQITVLPVSVS